MTKLLIVDDEAISALTLSRYLSDNNYEVRTAGSGREAMRIAEEYLPDILLSDWKLQDEIDGLELVRRLSLLNENMKSIIISGLFAEDVPDDGTHDRIFKFLNKPCSISQVLSTVQAAIREQELEVEKSKVEPRVSKGSSSSGRTSEPKRENMNHLRPVPR